MDLVGDAIENGETKRRNECYPLQTGNLFLEEECAIGQPTQYAKRRRVRNLVALWNVNVGKSMLGRQPENECNPDESR